MTDVTNKTPLRVNKNGSANASIRLPADQVPEVQKLLDGHAIRYWVDGSYLSINESPFQAVIYLYKELDEVMYERPAGWFAYSDDRPKLGCPSADEIARFAEAKATRDVLVHNRGVASKVYEAKAGDLARYQDGERMDLPEPYRREIWELVRKMAADVSDEAIAEIR